MTSTNIVCDPKRDHLDTNVSNQLVVVPAALQERSEKRLMMAIPKKKDVTGGKKSKNYAKEREKQKMTKKMKRQLAAVQQRKANRLTQEELFASLAEYQVDTKKLNQLGSSTHMQEKLEGDDSCTFPTKIKSVFSKIILPPTIHEKERKQENYYPTDDENSDEDEDEGIEVENPITSSVDQNKPDLVESANEKELTVPPKEVKVEDDEELAKPASPPVQRKRVLIARDPNIETKRAQLPIYSEEVPIMETINDNIVTVICGETGSGKTTQIPQFSYEAGYANDGHLIGITEPRCVAAISMAQRVGEELTAPDEVSYQESAPAPKKTLPMECLQRLQKFDETLTSLETALAPILEVGFDDHLKKTALELVQVDVMTMFVLNSLRWCLTAQQGRDPKDSVQLADELKRMKQYVDRVKSIELRKSAPGLNRRVAKAFIRNAPWEVPGKWAKLDDSLDTELDQTASGHESSDEEEGELESDTGDVDDSPFYVAAKSNLRMNLNHHLRK